METIYSFSTNDVVYLKNLYTGSIRLPAKLKS